MLYDSNKHNFPFEKKKVTFQSYFQEISSSHTPVTSQSIYTATSGAIHGSGNVNPAWSGNKPFSPANVYLTIPVNTTRWASPIFIRTHVTHTSIFIATRTTSPLSSLVSMIMSSWPRLKPVSQEDHTRVLLILSTHAMAETQTASTSQVQPILGPLPPVWWVISITLDRRT